MGRVLQIRVSASTFRDEDVAREWPRLVALAWPDEYVVPGGKGVLQLVGSLADAHRFAGWKPDVREKLAPGIDKAVMLRAKLEEALADWNPREANALGDSLEETLDALENLAPKP